MRLLAEKSFEEKLYRIFRVFSEDWEEISSEVLEVEESSFDERQRQKEEDFLRTLGREGSIFLVVYGERGIVGYAMGGLLEEYREDKDGGDRLEEDEEFGKRNTFYLESIAVHPEERGKGLGTWLCEVLIDEARREGFERFSTLAVSKLLQRILVEKMGFRTYKVQRDLWGFEEVPYIVGRILLPQYLRAEKLDVVCIAEQDNL